MLCRCGIYFYWNHHVSNSHNENVDNNHSHSNINYVNNDISFRYNNN